MNDDKSKSKSKSIAYKSLSKINKIAIGKKGFDNVEIETNVVNVDDNIIIIQQEEEEEEEEKKKNDDIVDDEYMKLKRFGNIEIGILTKSIGGKSLDDIILLKDIIIQFQTVIKQQARIKLIKSFAAKKKKDRKS
eukprot:31679_1